MAVAAARPRPADQATRQPRPPRGHRHRPGRHHRPTRPGGRPAGHRRRRRRPRRGPPGRVGLSGRGHGPDGRQLPRPAARPSTSWPPVSGRGSSSSTWGSPDRRRRPSPRPGVTYLGRRVRAGTDDLSVGPAMTRDEALQAIGVGLAVADATWPPTGVELLGVGEMGIGNTTAASAIVAAMTGAGRGVGDRVAGPGWTTPARARKIATIERALATHTGPLRTIRSGSWRPSAGWRSGRSCGLLIGAAAAAHPGRPRRVHHRRGGAAGGAPRPGPARRGCSPAIGRWSPGHAVVLARLVARPAARPRPAARGGDRRGAGDGHRHGRGPPARRDGDVRVCRRVRAGLTWPRRPSPSSATPRRRGPGIATSGRRDPPLDAAGQAAAAELGRRPRRRHRPRRPDRVEPAATRARDRRGHRRRDRCADHPRRALAGGRRRVGRGPDLPRHRGALAGPSPGGWPTARRPSTGPTARPPPTSTAGRGGLGGPRRRRATDGRRRPCRPAARRPRACASVGPQPTCGCRSRPRSCGCRDRVPDRSPAASNPPCSALTASSSAGPERGAGQGRDRVDRPPRSPTSPYSAAVAPNPTTGPLAATIATAATASATEIPSVSGMATARPSAASIASRSKATYQPSMRVGDRRAPRGQGRPPGVGRDHARPEVGDRAGREHPRLGLVEDLTADQRRIRLADRRAVTGRHEVRRRRGRRASRRACPRRSRMAWCRAC